MKRNLMIFLIVVLLAGALPLAALAEDIIIDIKPDDEDNLLTVNRKSLLPVAIYNAPDIDTATIFLEGVAVTTSIDKGDYLLLKFDAQAVLAAIGPVEDGDVVDLVLEGEYEGDEFTATDFVTIRARGH
jgi:hypothetical protein